jgi:hypothetical protein
MADGNLDNALGTPLSISEKNCLIMDSSSVQMMWCCWNLEPKAQTQILANNFLGFHDKRMLPPTEMH